jgi:DNA-binding transcriptional MerR regulator
MARVPASANDLNDSTGVAPAAPKSAERLLQVGELAEAVGKTVRAIHHYEELGLLQPDARSKGRFRLYDQEAVTRVRWIGKLHDLGLSLTQIQEVVATWEHAPSAGRANAAIREMYATKLDETRSQITRLKDLEAELQLSIAYLDECEPCDTTLAKERLVKDRDLVRRGDVRREPAGCADHPPEVGSCVTCEMRERENEPELVAGLLSRTRSKQT